MDVHIEELGRTPDGGGHRVHGRAAAQENGKSSGPGCAHLRHRADDDPGRPAPRSSPDDCEETVAACWIRAHAHFLDCDVAVKRVVTDNGSAYRPQTNGKVERFHRIPLDEWAYARPQGQRSRACRGPRRIPAPTPPRHTAPGGHVAARLTVLSGRYHQAE